MAGEIERLSDKLDSATVRLTEVSTRMQDYMQTQSELNRSLTEGLKGVNSDITRMKLADAASPHQCAEEIRKHESSSWAHDPKKAMGLAAGLFALVEGAKKIFHW